MYFITTKRMLEVCFSAHPNIQYRTVLKILHEIKETQLLHPAAGSPGLFPAAGIFGKLL